MFDVCTNKWPLLTQNIILTRANVNSSVRRCLWQCRYRISSFSAVQRTYAFWYPFFFSALLLDDHHCSQRYRLKVDWSIDETSTCLLTLKLLPRQIYSRISIRRPFLIPLWRSKHRTECVCVCVFSCTHSQSKFSVFNRFRMQPSAHVNRHRQEESWRLLYSEGKKQRRNKHNDKYRQQTEIKLVCNRSECEWNRDSTKSINNFLAGVAEQCRCCFWYIVSLLLSCTGC